MLLIPGVVILLNEAKIFLPLPLQCQLPPLCVCREVALQTGIQSVGDRSQWHEHLASNLAEQWLGNYLRKRRKTAKRTRANSFWGGVDTVFACASSHEIHMRADEAGERGSISDVTGPAL